MENIVISKVYEFTLDTKNSKPTKANIFPNLLDSVLFKINVTENNLPKTLTNSTISLLIVKESGTVVRQTENINIADDIEGIVEINLKSSCVDEIGLYMAQLTISDQDEAIRTGRFIYNVSSIIDSDIIEDAQDKVSVLDELERRIEELNDKIVEGAGFSGDYNDLINKPIIPDIDVNKDYVDTELFKKANKDSVYDKTETYAISEVDGLLADVNGMVNGVYDDFASELELYSKKTELLNKVDKLEGKGLSTNDFTNEEKMKLEILKNYVHPNDANTRHVSDAERLLWNDKADKTVVNNANNGLMTPTMKIKLDGISTNANNYNHPPTHPASMILQDSYNRFVTDEEKTRWNNSIGFDGDYNNLINKPTIPNIDVDKDYVDNELSKKADIINVYNKTEVDGLLEGLGTPPADLTNYYTKTETDNIIGNLDGKIDGAIIDKTEIESRMNDIEVDQFEQSVSLNNINTSLNDTNEILDNVITEKLDGHSFKWVTKAQYTELENAGQLDLSTEYFITDSNEPSIPQITEMDKGKMLVVKTDGNGLEYVEKPTGGGDGGYTHPSTHPATMITQDSSNRFVSDSEKVTWNAKSNFDGNYNSLTNKPTIPTVDVTKSYVDTELAKKAPTTHSHTKAQITDLPTDIATESFVTDKIAEAQLNGEEVDLSHLQPKSDSALVTNDKNVVGAINELSTQIAEPITYEEWLSLTEEEKENGYYAVIDFPEETPVDLNNYYTKSEVENVISERLNNLSFWTGTQEEYDALPSKNDSTIYFIKKV